MRQCLLSGVLDVHAVLSPTAVVNGWVIYHDPLGFYLVQRRHAA